MFNVLRTISFAIPTTLTNTIVCIVANGSIV